MGEAVAFQTTGATCHGYLAMPREPGPAVVIIQEWWGLVDHIKDVAERFASAGYVALAPDLYHGRATTEPDEAGKLLMSLKVDRAARDIAGAFEFLRGVEMVSPKKIGVIGFCMGGTLALVAATVRPFEAVAAFYPYPFTEYPAELLHATVQLHVGADDDAPAPETAQELAERIRAAGREVEVHEYAGASHAFFNDDRETYVPDAARLAWRRVLELFEARLR